MIKLGKQIVQQSFIAKRNSDGFFNTFSRQIRKLNKDIHKQAIKLYDILLDRLIVDGVSIASSMDNFELLSAFMPQFDIIINRYRIEYRKIYESGRINLFELVKDKELRITKVVAKMGVNDDRVTLGENTLSLMNAINENMYRNIENMLIKWRGFVYDTFFQGISMSMQKSDLRANFITPTGNLKIGSSLEETSELEAAMAIVSERTAYLRDQARRNNYRYCWNSNPMDPRTKAICMQATLAGVISESDMLAGYGFPPRFICRCEIVYTHEDWVELNQGINIALREARTRLIQELIDAPRQLSEYYVGTKLVIPKDPARRAGNKMYSDVEEKLQIARETEVPDFELYEP